MIALDLPGFGRSAPPDAPWGAADYAEAVVPVLDAMTRPVVVVGHSFGGRVAVTLAAERPDDVGALVLTGVPLLHRAGRRAAPPAPSSAPPGGSTAAACSPTPGWRPCASATAARTTAPPPA